MTSASAVPVIRDLSTLDEYQECVELQEETWGRGFSERVPTAILRVSQMVGGITAGAFDSDDRMMGFVFGLTGVRHGRLAHWSDMLAVRPEYQGRHIGERLKAYQREQVLALGVGIMYWTFDPLVARNAHLNINRLGAHAAEYVVNMYGTTGSVLHGSEPTDRFVAEWDLTCPFIPEPGTGTPQPGDGDIPLLNPLGDDGRPVLQGGHGADAVRVQIPNDVQQVSSASGDRLAWRVTFRDAVAPRLRQGWRVVRFVRPGDTSCPYYVLTAQR